MADLLAGWGAADITPQVPVALMGQFETRIATEVGAPLRAVALAVAAEGQTPAYWVGCDLLFTPASLTDAAAERLAGRIPGFAREQLILSATHIHTGPFPEREGESSLLRYRLTDPEITPPEAAMARAADGIAAAVLQAHEALEPSFVQTAVSQIQTGYCRRVVYSDGSAAMYGRVDRPDFSHMEYHDGGPTNLLYTRRAADGALTGVVANVPCTAQVVENKYYITSDCWGYARAAVERALGPVPVLGLIGCAGDLSPRDLLSALPDEPNMHEEDGCRALGERIAGEINALADCPEATVNDGALYRHLYRQAWLPRWNPTVSDARRARETLDRLNFQYCLRPGDDPFAVDGLPRLEYSEAEVVLRRFEESREYVSCPLHVLRLGDAVFVTNPFECYIEYADRIKAACKPLHIFDVQLAGDSMGYLATRRAVRGGGYSAMIFNGQCAPEGGDALVRESVALIRAAMADGKGA